LITKAYWIYVTNSDNWTITKKTNILGASARNKNTLSRVKKGDKCLVYVKGEKIARETVEPIKALNQMKLYFWLLWRSFNNKRGNVDKTGEVSQANQNAPNDDSGRYT